MWIIVRQAEFGRKEELAALADLAFHVDFAVHQPDQTLRDGQAQTGASKPSRAGHLHLLECVKDRELPVAGDANPRITHHKLHLDLSVGSRLEANLEHDFPLRRELDGVADQVGNDLPQAILITDKHTRQVRIAAVDQLQALLLRPYTQRLQQMAKRLIQVEDSPVELQPAGLHDGEIQDVVDQDQQGFARLLYNIQILALVSIQVGGQHQIGHADHRIHGRADLMAHVGQQHALRAIGLLTGVAGDLQFPPRGVLAQLEREGQQESTQDDPGDGQEIQQPDVLDGNIAGDRHVHGVQHVEGDRRERADDGPNQSRADPAQDEANDRYGTQPPQGRRLDPSGNTRQPHQYRVDRGGNRVAGHDH